MSAEAPCLVIAGPSGVGKSTLIHEALVVNPNWKLSVSATTRPRREGEADGREYHFLDQAQFEHEIQEGRFLEYASVYGHWYGTPVSELTNAKTEQKCLLIEVDTIGCLSIRALKPWIPLMAILPPSIAVLMQRLRDRGTEDDSSLKLRFANMVSELQRMRGFDFTIINDDLTHARDELLSVMQVVENELHRVEVRIDKLFKESGGSK